MPDSPDLPSDPLERLLWVMRRLRAPDGCAWDRAQTPETIAPYTIEEAYEVADAIRHLDPDRPISVQNYKEELGDLLFQVVFYAQMADEAGQFSFPDVAAAIADKMIRRHAHIFAEFPAESPEEIHKMWENLKAEERARKASEAMESGTKPSLLDDVPVALPGLTRAIKLQKRAARVGFDWTTVAPILEKLREEVAEVEEVLAEEAPSGDRLEDEIGDVLFVVANLARRLDVDPEKALRRTNAKFERRFRYIESALAERGVDPAEAGLDAMEAEWQAAKRHERQTVGAGAPENKGDTP